MIKEVIVVEGKDDITAVKAALDAEVLSTNGFGYKKELVDTLRSISERRGLIILTDPDYAGEQIRKDLSKRIKNCKHAFLPRDKALKDGDIGIENAKPEDIIEALEKARVETTSVRFEFSKADLFKYGLVGTNGSNIKRDLLGRLLGIGHCNSKQFLKRLNNYGITRNEFEEAISEVLIEDE